MADVFAYEITGPGSDLFGVIDLNTGVFTSLGDTGQTLAGLGSYGGVIYGAPDHGNTLYTVNTSTGALTAIGAGNIGGGYALLGSTTAGLYALGWDDALYSINPVTGAATDLGSTNIPFGTVMGISAGSNTLYVTTDNSLYALSTINGSATLIGSTTEGETGFGALVTVGGVLYGGAYGASTPDIYALNPQTGAATFVAASPSTPFSAGVAGFWGLAPIAQAAPPPPPFQGLGFAPGNAGSEAWAVNANGSIVVGASYGLAGTNPYVAVFWTAATGVVPIAGRSGGRAQADGVSSDGSVVVGFDNGQVFRWTAATGEVLLGAGLGLDVSGDGAVVVGVSGGQAFRWTASTGMVALGSLPGGTGSRAIAKSW